MPAPCSGWGEEQEQIMKETNITDSINYQNDIEDGLKETVYDYIKGLQTVSICEINNRFGQGNHTWILDEEMNVAVGIDMRENVIGVISQLIYEKRIHPHLTSAIVYVMDGCNIGLPIAKRPPKEGYKELHWLPIVLNTRASLK
jgi:hypothetical protein